MLSNKLSRRKFILIILFNFILLSNFDFLPNGAVAYNPTSIEVEKIDIKVKNLPASFNNFTIAQISDLHRSSDNDVNLFNRTISIVNELSADLIVITGDIANNTSYLEEASTLLSDLIASYGVYYITGNWEVGFAGNKAVEIVNKSKLKVISDGFVYIEKEKSKIVLAGINDDNGYGNMLETTFNNIDDKYVKILLAHNPYIMANISKANRRIDLVLSGHTHGGQVVYPIIGPLKLHTQFGRRYISGLYKEYDTYLYVNRGIGVSHTTPYRINCPPEVTLITLKSE